MPKPIFLTISQFCHPSFSFPKLPPRHLFLPGWVAIRTTGKKHGWPTDTDVQCVCVCVCGGVWGVCVCVGVCGVCVCVCAGWLSEPQARNMGGLQILMCSVCMYVCVCVCVCVCSISNVIIRQRLFCPLTWYDPLFLWTHKNTWWEQWISHSLGHLLAAGQCEVTKLLCNLVSSSTKKNLLGSSED